MSRPRRLLDILEEAHKQIREGNRLSHEDFWKHLDAVYTEPQEPEKAPPKSGGRKPRKS